jgi:hypothetical protein
VWNSFFAVGLDRTFAVKPKAKCGALANRLRDYRGFTEQSLLLQGVRF